MTIFPILKTLAYSENITHPGLAEATVGLYNLSFKDKINNHLKDLIISGAEDEDANIRPFNHFYDPTYGIGLMGYNSALYWAINDSYANDYSWSKALKYYTEGDKNRAFYTLGHVLHIVEDMTVPEHTRSDQHLNGSIFEAWVKNNFAEDDIVSLSKKYSIVEAKNFDNLNVYLQFLAKYSNENFFSADTINNDTSFYKHNKPKLTNYDENYIYGTDSLLGNEHILLKKIKDDNGKISNLLIDKDKKDPSVLQDYFSRLSKQAVINGAMVIKLFIEKGEEAKLAYIEKLKQEQLATELENQKLADKLANQGLFGQLFTGLGFLVSDTFTTVNNGVVAVVSPVSNFIFVGTEITGGVRNMIFIGGTQGIKYIAEQTYNFATSFTNQTFASVQNFVSQTFSLMTDLASAIFAFDATSTGENISNPADVATDEEIIVTNSASTVVQNTVSTEGDMNSESVVANNSDTLSPSQLVMIQASIATYLANQTQNNLSGETLSTANTPSFVENNSNGEISSQSSPGSTHHHSNGDSNEVESAVSTSSEAITATSTATTTDSLVSDTATSTATSTDPITSDETATTTDPIEDDLATTTDPFEDDEDEEEDNTATSTATTTDPIDDTATSTPPIDDDLATTTATSTIENNYVLSLTEDPCTYSLLSPVCLLLDNFVSFTWETNSTTTANYFIDWHDEYDNAESLINSVEGNYFQDAMDNGHLFNFEIKAVDSDFNTSNIIEKELNIWPHAITINEISWSGTVASSSDQWLELYNWTNLEIPLDDFAIKNNDSSINISLDGITILPNSYLVIQRKNPGAESFATDAPIPDVSGLWTDWGGELNPAGESLYLISNAGEEEIYVDEISYAENWNGYGQSGRSIEKSALSSCWNNLSDNDDSIAKNGHDKAGNEILGTPGQPNSIMIFTDGIPETGSCFYSW
ncbi:MAG: hypothetical protein WAV11_01395 [Minisyncoccia bacterium]